MKNLLYRFRQYLFSRKIIGSLFLLITIFGWFLTSGLLPYAVWSVFIPLVSEAEQTTGEIRDKIKTEEEFTFWAKGVKHKTMLVRASFVIGADEVRVPLNEYGNYEEGDRYTFVRYRTKGGESYVHFEKYSAGKGAALVFLFFLCTLTLVWLVLGKDQQESSAPNIRRSRSVWVKAAVVLLILCGFAVCGYISSRLFYNHIF